MFGLVYVGLWFILFALVWVEFGLGLVFAVDARHWGVC